MNNILLTGASGYSGRKVSEYLDTKNNKVLNVYFKNKLKKKSSIKYSLLKPLNIKQNFNIIIHSASHHKISDFKIHPIIKKNNNIVMTKNLINFCHKKKIKKFIFFSTIDLNFYPYPKKKIDYINSKKECERLLYKAFKQKKIDNLFFLRLPAIVDKKSTKNFISETIKNIKKHKNITIWNQNKLYDNFVHINDLSKLIYFLIKNEKKRTFKIIDCKCSEPIKLNYLVKYLIKKLKSKSSIKIRKKVFKKFKIKNNKKYKYKFFKTKKAIDMLI